MLDGQPLGEYPELSPLVFYPQRVMLGYHPEVVDYLFLGAYGCAR